MARAELHCAQQDGLSGVTTTWNGFSMTSTTRPVPLKLTTSLDALFRLRSTNEQLGATVTLDHLYLRLDFKHEFENATTAEAARGFLRSVARAAAATHELASRYGGSLLEVQGSTIHVGLPHSSDSARRFARDLHAALTEIFDRAHSRVDGWRMTADYGPTLIVPSRGVHNDESLVSLGAAANRPAKHLHAQLELPESSRLLKRFHLGTRDSRSGEWRHEALDAAQTSLTEIKAIAASARSFEPVLHYFEAIQRRGLVARQAASIGPPGSASSPAPDRPHRYFGWVARADLDGFSARVAACHDDAEQLGALGAQFIDVMNAGTQFVARHSETLVQLPWAGDNFTAAAIFPTRDEHDVAASTRLVELSLDFEKEMRHAVDLCAFGGWAHGVAGGVPVGSSHGNVYIAGVEVGDRRFLVGTGEGFGRSTQAFGDINPHPSEVVLYGPDWERLAPEYRSAFKPATTRRNEESSLYRIATVAELIRVRANRGASPVTTSVTFAAGTRPITSRPYFA